MTIPNSFLRFYKDGFGVQAYSFNYGQTFYFVSEQQHLLDWVVEPVDEKRMISAFLCRVPVPEGTHFVDSALKHKDEGSLDEGEDAVVLFAKNVVLEKARLLTPLMYQANEYSMASLELPEYRILRFALDEM